MYVPSSLVLYRRPQLARSLVRPSHRPGSSRRPFHGPIAADPLAARQIKTEMMRTVEQGRVHAEGTKEELRKSREECLGKMEQTLGDFETSVGGRVARCESYLRGLALEVRLPPPLCLAPHCLLPPPHSESYPPHVTLATGQRGAREYRRAGVQAVRRRVVERDWACVAQAGVVAESVPTATTLREG